MPRTLEFYFDYGSPYSYLADTQVEAIAQRAGATLVRKPMLLGGVFKATGNHSPAELPQKSAWSAFDMPLWARHYGVPFQRNPFFPVNTLALMRGVFGAPTCFVDNMMFFGNDRLPFVEMALKEELK